jgi:cell wall-associated NlpC family hydrolase
VGSLARGPDHAARFSMTREQTGNRGRIARGALALLLALSASVLTANVSLASPSKKDVEAAKAKLAALNDRLSLLDEQFNQEQIKLGEIQARLADARKAAAAAQAVADEATADLNARAARAYQGVGSELELLLGSTSFGEFSDRLEFMGHLAQADADVATKAANAKQQAKWAAERASEAMKEQQSVLASLRQKQSELRSGIAKARSLYQQLDKKYHAALAAAAAAAAAAAQVPRVSPPPGGPPPAPNPRAQAAIDAAYSVIGTPYVYGSADPNVGFDCSGLTMWSWAHAGVSLPHSSEMQYEALPHLQRSELQPGDLLFFYSPIHHVGMYIGGDRMIDANHPGDVVNIRPITWDVYVGAGRP